MHPLITHFGIKHLLTAKAEKSTKHVAAGGYRHIFEPKEQPKVVIKPVSKICI